MDREKVIKGWECHMEADTLKCADCPYREGWRTCNYADTLYKDVYALLKEQEPILLENQHKPYGISTNANSPWISRCPRCGKKVEGKQTRFCKYCGQAVKWE